MRIGDNKGAKYASDNFWMMGDTGPLGPAARFSTTTVHTFQAAAWIAREDGDRFIEIWNSCSCSSTARVKDGPMIPLPKPSVDTGMGLGASRRCLQHVHANYEIDLFQR